MTIALTSGSPVTSSRAMMMSENPPPPTLGDDRAMSTWSRSAWSGITTPHSALAAKSASSKMLFLGCMPRPDCVRGEGAAPPSVAST
jgi:hypothetical protein